MREELKNFIKNNQTTILVSVSASTLTVIILTTIGGVILAVNSGSFLNSFAPFWNKSGGSVISNGGEMVKTDMVAEESHVIEVVEKASPAVVSDVPIIKQYYQEFIIPLVAISLMTFSSITASGFAFLSKNKTELKSTRLAVARGFSYPLTAI